MTNKEIKEARGIFKKLNIPIYVENFCEKLPSFSEASLFEIWTIKLNFNDNLDIHIVFDFLDKGKCEFNLKFKGDLVDTNCKIGLKSNYFRLFNKVCKNSYKFEIVKNKKLDYNLCVLFDVLGISYNTVDKMTLLTEILINNYIITKYIKYMWDYDIIKYNQKIIDKKVDKYERRLKYKLHINNIYYNIKGDRVISETERLYLLEEYYNKYVIKNIKY